MDITGFALSAGSQSCGSELEDQCRVNPLSKALFTHNVNITMPVPFKNGFYIFAHNVD